MADILVKIGKISFHYVKLKSFQSANDTPVFKDRIILAFHPTTFPLASTSTITFCSMYLGTIRSFCQTFAYMWTNHKHSPFIW